MFLNNENDEKKGLLESRSIPQEFFDIERVQSVSQQRPMLVPNFIKNQSSLLERSKFIKCICCCQILCCPKSYQKNLTSNISNKELLVYYNFKSLAAQIYDEENSSHEESLRFLHVICLPSEPSVDLRSKEWTKLGFQVKIFYSRVKIHGQISEVLDTWLYSL
jgi:hypothetical protein